MNKPLFAIVAAVTLLSCGKSQEQQNAENALKAIAEVATNAGDNQAEAERFYADRKAKGDTVAMPYTELQKLLPATVGDYKPEGEPGGSSQSMGGWSMSQAEQTYNMPATADGTTPSVHITIADLGGTQAAYGMMAMPMMMNLAQEDAHRRMKTGKLSPPYTWAAEEFDKDNKDSKVTAVTRYRYMVTVEARGQTSDQTDMVKRVVEDIVRSLAGK